ncbi:MAG: sulfatase-like hydrolase/transferase [Verrucomicrobiales bacterium]
MKSPSFALSFFWLSASALAAQTAESPLAGPWFTGSASATPGTPSLSDRNADSFVFGTAPESSGSSARRGMVWGYFPETAALEEGDAVELRFRLRWIGADSESGSDALRFGIFHDGGSRVEEDIPGDNSDAAFEATTGYFATWGPQSGAAKLWMRGNTGGDNPLSTSRGTPTQVAGTSLTPGAGPQGIDYDVTLKVEAIAGGQVELTSSLNGTALHTTVAPAAGAPLSFNAFFLLNTPSNGIDSLALSDLTLAFTDGDPPVPPEELPFVITAFDLGPQPEPVGGGPVLRWNAVPGRAYAVEGSGDLDDWQRLGPPVLADAAEAGARIGPASALPPFLRVRDLQNAPPDPAAPEPPNVLFIAVDDLRPEIGAYGAGYMHTPNIDRLAAAGRLFTRHYVQCPTCGASRYALMTRRPTTSASTSNEAFAQLFPGAGTPQAELAAGGVPPRGLQNSVARQAHALSRRPL